MKYIFTTALVLITASAPISCGDKAAVDSPKAASSKNMAPAAPVITDNSNKLMFNWFEGNEAKTAMSVADVPEDARKEVRVQDLSIPPDKRDPEWIFLANLSKKNPKGQYDVRVVPRQKYEAKRHPEQKATPAPDSSVGAASGVSVIMYATAHCPHCKRARRWLLEQKIPYKEVDLEKDESAAAVLAQKGAAQGVPTGGVPMFEINGRLIPGFDPAAIQKAIKMPPLKQVGVAPMPKMPPLQPPPGPAPTTPGQQQPQTPPQSAPSSSTMTI
ncbi:MAG: glutaredoxin family protein [Deltaproteobacteria bacterium]|nr:glutaredoxin family protein [Deltaproteobacteria bacterium]